MYDITVGYGIPVGHPATAVTARPSQPHTGRGAPAAAAGAPGRTYVGFTSPGNGSLSMSFLRIDVKNINLQIKTFKNAFFHFYKKNIKKHA